jgi:DNA-binding MarR family transcriptional regulator
VANQQLLLKAATTSQYVTRIVERHLEPIGIPGYLLALVTHIRDHAPVTPSGISVASGVPMTTLRDNIQRLVDRRLARRTRHPDDGRSYQLVLTARGQAMIRAADPALARAYDELERRLPRPLAEYEEMLDELNGALHGALEPTLPAVARAHPAE